MFLFSPGYIERVRYTLMLSPMPQNKSLILPRCFQKSATLHQQLICLEKHEPSSIQPNQVQIRNLRLQLELISIFRFPIIEVKHKSHMKNIYLPCNHKFLQVVTILFHNLAVPATSY